MSECYQQKKGDLGQASIILNHLGIVSMKPALKEKAYALGTELGYLAITNSNAEDTYFNFELNSKPESIIRIAKHSIAFANQIKNYKSEYEILKILKRTAVESGITEIIDDVEKRMTELALKHGNLSLPQKFRLQISTHINLLLIYLISLFPFAVFVLRILSSCKTQGHAKFKIDKTTLVVELKKSVKMIIGTESNSSYIFQTLRSFWIFLLGSLLTFLAATSTVDLGGIILP